MRTSTQTHTHTSTHTHTHTHSTHTHTRTHTSPNCPNNLQPPVMEAALLQSFPDLLDVLLDSVATPPVPPAAPAQASLYKSVLSSCILVLR